MSITIDKFRTLDIEQQTDAINCDAVYLIHRKSQGYVIALFSLGEFFVEVWSIQGTTEIELISSFKSTGNLEPYLDFITLPL